MIRGRRTAAASVIVMMMVAPAWATETPRSGAAAAAGVGARGVLAGGPVHGMVINFPNKDPRLAVPDFPRLRADGVNTVSMYIAWRTESTTSSALAPTRKTPSDQTLVSVSSAAHAAGLAVEWMPLVLVPGSPRLWWHPSDTTTFWRNYQAMIDSYATLARDNGVEIFCIGSEYHDLQSDAAHWSALADRVRAVDGYRGLTTYMSAGGMDGVTWWPSVDLIGVSPYYSLSSAAVPSVAALKSAWTNTYLPFLKNLSDTYRRPVLMDEIGYASQQGTANDPGNAWRRSGAAKPSLKAQANAYRALIDVAAAPAQLSWLRGVVWFGWDKPTTVVLDKTYTPREKPAETVLASSWGTAAAAYPARVRRAA